MKKELLEKFQNRRVRLILKNGFTYTGYIQVIEDETLQFRDKYNKDVFIALNSISEITEQ